MALDVYLQSEDDARRVLLGLALVWPHRRIRRRLCVVRIASSARIRARLEVLLDDIIGQQGWKIVEE